MSKSDKLKAKLKNKDAAFTWSELVTLLTSLGYMQLEGSGSRVKFSNGDPEQLISLHRPHPGNELKSYIRKQIIQTLSEGGLI